MATSAQTKRIEARGQGGRYLVIADVTLEALKWLGLMLMTVDHINKYLLHDAVPAMFNAGRLTLPIFGFVLAYNLSRPDTLSRGVYGRTMARLALSGALATPAFIGLGGLAFGWWPLNIMFTLLVVVATLYLIERGGKARVAAAAVVFLIGGSSVEFWWPALAYCIAAWWYCKRPGLTSLLLWIAACASLWVINRNLWALATLPIVYAATHVDVRVPRWRYAFYAYYPAHLTLLWLSGLADG